MPVVRAVANYGPDLSSSLFNDPVKLIGMRLLINQAEREIAYELSNSRLMYSLISAVFLHIEATLAIGQEKKDLKEYVDRSEVLAKRINATQDLAAVALGVLDRMSDSKQPSSVSDPQQKAFADAKDLWERVFGKRGDPTVEAKVAQTEAILKGKINQSNEEQKQKAKPKRRRRRRFG